tara:strand:- start:147 stop:557 length:411 start_codon:yes stop_codon:yes gene_type:complete
MTAVLTYYSRAGFLLKLIAMPIAVLTSLAAMWTMISLSGAPINKIPYNNEWVYLGHQTIDKGSNIVLWLWDKELKDFRLYKFPYDRETQKKLQEANQESGNGMAMEGNFTKDKETGDATLSMSRYVPVDGQNNVKE